MARPAKDNTLEADLWDAAKALRGSSGSARCWNFATEAFKKDSQQSA